MSKLRALCLTRRLVASYDLAMAYSDDNLYAPPVMDRPTPEWAGESPLALQKLVQKFRVQSRALAGEAFFCAVISALAGIASTNDPYPSSVRLATVFGVLSGTLLAIGIGTGLKKVRAIQAMLVANWLMVLASLLSAASIPPVGLFLAAVFALAANQCHRVLGWSRQIRAAGYPLSAKPHEIPLTSP
jgi:hypothetical protein